MKILQLVGTFGPVGGLEMYVARWSERLCEIGHSTVVAAHHLAALEQTSYEVRHIPGFIGPTGRGTSQAENEVLAVAQEFQPDIIVSHNTANYGLLTALDSQFPTVEFVHVFLCGGSKLFRNGERICTRQIGPRCLVDWYLGPCGNSKSPLNSWRDYQRSVKHLSALKSLTGVVVGSTFMQDYLLKEGIPEKHLYVTDYTIGIPPQKPVGRVQIADRNILFVGRVVYNKGVQYVIRALTLLDESYRLTIAGDGYYLENLKQLAAELGVEKRVHFAGFIHGEALEAAYKQASVAVVPSIWPEPAGLVVPEPRGRGLPVVVFDVGGLGEWASRYDSVYCARHTDVQSLADEIVNACAGQATASYDGIVSETIPLETILEGLVKIDTRCYQ